MFERFDEADFAEYGVDASAVEEVRLRVAGWQEKLAANDPGRLAGG